MKKFLCYLILALSLVSFISSAAIKKEKYKPDGKELFIFNEYTPNSSIRVHTDPKPKQWINLPVEKYRGMTGYVDKIISTDIFDYKKIIFENGDVFYLSNHLNSISKPTYESEETLINAADYQKIKNDVEEVKKIKVSNIDDIFVKTVTAIKNDINTVTLSNELTLSWSEFKALQNFLKNISDHDDAKFLLNTLKDGGISLRYDQIDDIYQISMVNNSSMEMFLKIFGSDKIIPIAQVTYSSSNWVFANGFAVFQENKKLIRNNVKFERESSSVVVEWYNFICSQEDLNHIKSLNENDEATIRFYGANRNEDKQVSKGDIERMKKIIKLYDMLTKYYTH